MTFDPTTAVPEEAFDPSTAAPDNMPSARERLSIGAKFNPDEAAKASSLAQKRGLPADTVLRNLREVELRDSVEKADILLRSAPVLREQFRSIADLPKTAHDDVEPLSMVEASVNAFKRGLKATGRGFDATEIARDAELLNLIDRIEKGEFADDAELARATPYASMFAGSGRQPVMLEARKKQLQARIAENVADYSAATRALQNLPSTGSLSRFNRESSETFDDAFNDFMSAPLDITAQVFSESAGALLPSLPAIIAGAAFGGAPGLALTTGVTSAATEYVNALPGVFEKLKVDITDPAAVRQAVSTPAFAEEVRKVLTKAGVIGAVDAATGGVAGARLARGTSANLAAQTGVQMAGGATGEIAGSAAIGEEASIPAIISEMIGEVPGAVVDVATLAARRAVADGREASRAQTEADNLQELFTRAAGSKLRERSPDTFAELVQRMADSTEGAPSSVFIDAGKLGEVLNQEQIAEFLPSAVEQMAEVGATGGVIEVPIGELTARIAGTPLEQQLLPHLRTDPEGLSQEEAVAQGEDAAVFFQTRADDIIQQANDAMSLQAEVDTIKQTVLDQLNATQRFKPDVNEAYASLVGNFYTVQAQTAGVTPRELYERYPLRVQGVSPAGGVLNARRPAARQVDFTREGIGSVLDREDWAVLTAEDPNATKAPPEQNAAKMAELMADLDALGVEYAPAVGKYGDVQNALVVTGITEDQAVELGIKYGQESILTRKGLIYQDRSVTPARGVQVFDTPPDDYFTTLPDGSTFSIDLDFDQRLPADSPVLEQREAGDTRFQARATELLATLNPPARSAVAIMRGEQKHPIFKNLFELSRWFTQRNRRGMDDMTDPRVKARMLDALYADTLMALTDAGSAVGWYDAKVKAALAIMAEKHPEIATNEEAKFGFITILAITSNQTKVVENFELADAIYSQWKDTKVFPVDVGAIKDTRAKTEMSKSLVKMRDLMAQHGVDKMRQFMTTKLPAREIEAFTGYTLTGESKDSEVYGATFLGPKIGAFFNNLYGNFDTVTMDRWFMRTVNRIRGSMLDLPDSFGSMLDRLEAQVAEGADTFGVDPETIQSDIEAFRTLDTAQQRDILAVLPVVKNVRAYAQARHKVYAKGREVGGKQRSYVDRTPENGLAKNLDLALHADEQTPRGGADRQLMRELVSKLQQKLQSVGIDMVVADIQAALWYYEKDLKAKLRGERQQADMFGETQEAEDYETAARRIVAAGSGAGQGRDPAGPAGRARPAKLRADPAARAGQAVTGELFQGAQPRVGYHFSKQARTSIDGRAFGTGLKGAEQERLGEPGVDPRLKERVYVYLDTGNGVRPEAGVGSVAHEVPLGNLYDARNDPLKLAGGGANVFESKVLDAGYDGYWIPDATTTQGAAVIIGPASRNLPVRQINAPLGSGQPRQQEIAPTVYSTEATPEAAQAKAEKLAAKPGWAGYEVTAQGNDVVYRRPALAQGPRGTFSPSQLTITLLEKADLSTFLHETGHFFLEVMADLASQPGAPERAVKDFETTLAWFGVKGEDGAPAVDAWNAMTLDEKRPHHERWAESFEQYLFEGKAPSVEMRPLFARFRTFLIATYKTLRDFMAGRNLRISDDIRQVFDRLIATDQEIAEAERRAEYEALFGSAAEAGMTQEQWEDYQERSAASTQSATERLQARSLMDMKWVARARAVALREAKAAVEEKRAAMEASVKAELEATPVEQARAYIRSQRVSTPEQRDALKDWKGRREAAQERFTEEVKAELLATPEGEAAKGLARGQLLARNKREMALEVERRLLAWEKTAPRPEITLPDVDMDLLADRLGYDSADALRRDLTEQPQMAELVEPMTDQRLMETYGDLVTPQAAERAANEAVHNEARQRFIATEMAALREMMSATKDTGKTSRTGKPLRINVAVAAAKDFADRLIARRKVIDLKPAIFRGAEKRAGKRAAELQAEGKTQEAYAAKRDQLLNGVASQKAEAALSEVDRKLDYLRKFDSEGTRKALSQDYLDQIDQLLERYDLRRGTSARDIARRASLAEWIAAQQEQGLTPAVPADLVADSRQISYKQLTVEEFRGLVDAVRSIEHLGRLKNKLLKAKDAREFGVIAQEIADTIRESRPEREVKLEGMGGFEKFARGFAAEHRKLASLIYQMDGGKDDGPFYRAFTRTMNEAAVDEAVRNEKSTIDLLRIFAPMNKLPGGLTGRKSRVYIPEIKASLSRGGRLAVALNWGNAGNRQRLLDGDGWSEAQALAVIRTLTPAELKFVNDVWEHIDSYWPDIKAKQERVTGVVEEKVAAEPFELQLADGSTMQMRGGYYPIKYDTERSAEAEKNEAKESITQMLRGAMLRPTTRRGHTEARVAKVVGRPVRKSLNVITQHVHQVNHDLAWHEWFIDANRLMNDKRISSAIREHYGPSTAGTMKDDMEAIAAGQVGAETQVDAALLHLRNNISRSVMGVSFTTALLQPFGLTQSMARIGVGPVLKGAARWAGDAARFENSMTWISEKSDFMRLRSKTFNREIREISNKINGKSKTMEVVDAGLFFMMRKLQMVADVPTWIGMYEKAISEDKPEDAAVALADQAVLAAQGGGEIKDLAAVQRKHPMLTQFYSYFSTTLNLTAESTAKTDFKNPRAVAGWLGDMALLLVVPAILPSLLIYALRGGAEDDEPEDLAAKLAEWQASYALGMVVGLRELTGAVAGFDYAGPPAGRVIADITKAVKQTGQGEVDEPLVKSYISLLGSAFGIPTVQALRSYNGWQAWADGDAPASAILLGPPPKD